MCVWVTSSVNDVISKKTESSGTRPAARTNKTVVVARRL